MGFSDFLNFVVREVAGVSEILNFLAGLVDFTVWQYHNLIIMRFKIIQTSSWIMWFIVMFVIDNWPTLDSLVVRYNSVE